MSVKTSALKVKFFTQVLTMEVNFESTKVSSNLGKMQEKNYFDWEILDNMVRESQWEFSKNQVNSWTT
jgi:hypothetical protein